MKMPTNTSQRKSEEITNIMNSIKSNVKSAKQRLRQSRDQHNHHTLNAFYYSNHDHSMAIPDGGVLRLRPSGTPTSLSFKSVKNHFEWNLTDVEVDKFKGRVLNGVKVRHRPQDTSGASTLAEGIVNEYIFTKVPDASFIEIQQAIEEAKRRLVEATVTPRLKEAMESCPRDLATSLSNEMESTRETQSPLVRLPFHIFLFVFTFLLKCMLAISRYCTGHNYLLPQTMNDAIQNVLVALPAILTVSERNMQNQTIHLAIQQEVESVKKSLSTVSMLTRKREISCSAMGRVEEIKNETHSTLLPKKLVGSFSAALKQIVDVVFIVIWKLNLPMLRRKHLVVKKQPVRVGEAVKNVNYKVVDLIELVNEKYHDDLEMIHECRMIQQKLYAIKVLSLNELVPGGKKM